jgi:hypothetical protein
VRRAPLVSIEVAADHLSVSPGMTERFIHAANARL